MPFSNQFEEAVQNVQDAFTAAHIALKIPSGKLCTSLVGETWQHGVNAVSTGSHLIYITGRPFFMLIYFVLKAIYTQLRQLELWKWTQKCVVAVYKWETSRSRKHLMIQAGIVATIVAAYFLRQFWYRQTYTRRVREWLGEQKKRSQRQERRVKQFYRQQLERLAHCSQWLAIMTPHVVVFTGVAVLLFPLSGSKWLLALSRDTPILSIVTLIIPLVMTLYALHDYHVEESAIESKDEQASDKITAKTTDSVSSITLVEEENDDENSLTSENNKENNSTTPRYMTRSQTRRGVGNSSDVKTKKKLATPDKGSNNTKRALFPRTGPTKSPSIKTPKRGLQRKDHVAMSPSVTPAATSKPATVYESIDYWCRYWTVYFAVHGSKLCLYATPLLGRVVQKRLHLYLPLLELLFWTWVHVVPKLLVLPTNDTKKIEGRPLYFLSSWLIKWIYEYHHATSAIVPLEIWQSRVVNPATKVLDAFKMIKLLSASRHGQLVRLLTRSREFLIPIFLLLVPLLSRYGLLYLQYLIPLAHQWPAKTRDTKTPYANPSALHYWILQTLWSGMLAQVDNILWFIPFSQYFIAASYIAIQLHCDSWYWILQDECQTLGIFGTAPETGKKWQDTRTARMGSWIVARLPSARPNELKDLITAPLLDPLQTHHHRTDES